MRLPLNFRALVWALGWGWVGSPAAWAQASPETWTATSTQTRASEGTPAARARPEPPAEEEIVVTGSRTERRLSDSPVTTELVGRSELLRSGAENLTELLEEHPGIELERSTRGSGVRLFGLNPEHTLILVDGQRTTGRVGGGVDPSRFNVENIERMEIVKGPGSALYGSEAVAGVINLISRRPRKPLELFVRGGYGSFNTVDITASAGTRSGGLTSMFSGGYHRSDGFSLTPDGEATTGAAFDGFNVENSTRYQLSDAVTLVGRGDFRQLQQEALDITAGARIDRTQRTDVWSATLGPEIRIGPTGQLRALATYSDFRLQIVQEQRGSLTGENNDVQDIRQRLGQLNLQFDELFFSEHFVSIGAEGILESQDAELVGNQNRQRTRLGVFAQDEWTVLGDQIDLSIVPSVRLDVDSQFGSAFTPRLAARYQPTEELNLRVNYGWGFRAPTFEELYLDFFNPGSNYFVLGNEDLATERSQGATATVEYSPFDFVELSVHAFWLEVDDLIDTQRGAPTEGGQSTFQYVNVSSARSRGLETGLTVQPLPGLSLGVGYVLTDTLDRANDRELPGRARHKGTVHLSYHHDRWQTTATVRSAILGERLFFFDPISAPPEADGLGTVQAPAAVTFDLRLEQGLLDRFTVFVGAENLFDVGDALTLPTQPRSFYAGISAGYDVEASPDRPRGVTK